MKEDFDIGDIVDQVSDPDQPEIINPDDVDSDVIDADDIEQYNINDNDLVIVNQDGSYVVLPYDIGSILMGDPEFIRKVDIGFADIDEFFNYVYPILSKVDLTDGDNGEDNE